MNFYIPENIPETVLINNNYQLPRKVLVKPTANGIKLNCYNNVINYLKDNEGSLQLGWCFSMLGKFILKLHAHAVVSLPDGALMCVTPPEKRTEIINFSVDDNISNLIINNRLPVKCFAMLDDSIVKQFTLLENEAEEARLNGNQDMINQVFFKKEMIKEELLEFLKSNTKRNDVCYCGSSLKYKKCCGT